MPAAFLCPESAPCPVLGCGVGAVRGALWGPSRRRSFVKNLHTDPLFGTNKEMVLAHKAAIDKHLAEEGIPLEYTNVFWGGRSEIKPSEISPIVFKEWHAKWKDVTGPVVRADGRSLSVPADAPASGKWGKIFESWSI